MAGGLNPIGMLQGKTDSSGALIVSVDSGSTAVVTSVAGTANQVLVNGGTAAVGGAVTLSLSPTLAGIDSITFSGGHSLVGTTANVTTLSAGVWRSPVGTQAAPSYSFTGDTGTGMYQEGAGSLRFASAGSLVMRLSSANIVAGSGVNVVPTTSNNADVGSSGTPWRSIYAGTSVVSGTAQWRFGTGSPEGAVTAPVGSIYSRTDGGAATSFYVKESGAGNTGWVAK